MMRLLLLFLAWSAWSGPALASQAITVDVYGYGHLKADVAPIVQQGRVLVPLRAIAEALRAKVVWDSTTNTVKVIDPNNQVQLTVDSPVAYRNGRQLKLDVPATLKNGRVMAPVRLIAEALGAQVEWQKERRLISVSRGYFYWQSSLQGNEYWLNNQSGELYLLQGAGRPEKIDTLELTPGDYGQRNISAEETPQGNVLLTIIDNFGEPHLNDRVFSFYLRDNKLARKVTALYRVRPEPNIKFYREFVVMVDGRTAYFINDKTGKVEKTYDLKALAGEEDHYRDNYFLEAMGENFMLIRPDEKGFLTLVYLDTGEKVLLYRELLSAIEQDYAETGALPFRGDRLKLIEVKDGVLYFKNGSNLKKDDRVYQYPLAGRE